MKATSASTSRTRIASLFAAAAILFSTLPSSAAANGEWHGVWNAAGTPFTLRLIQEHDDASIRLEQIESLGFDWKTKAVRQEGNALFLDIDYAGVAGTIRVQRRDSSSAIATPLSCTPEYMVVCALSRGQQALFVRIESSAD